MNECPVATTWTVARHKIETKWFRNTSVRSPDNYISKELLHSADVGQIRRRGSWLEGNYPWSIYKCWCVLVQTTSEMSSRPFHDSEKKRPPPHHAWNQKKFCRLNELSARKEIQGSGIGVKRMSCGGSAKYHEKDSCKSPSSRKSSPFNLFAEKINLCSKYSGRSDSRSRRTSILSRRSVDEGKKWRKYRAYPNSSRQCFSSKRAPGWGFSFYNKYLLTKMNIPIDSTHPNNFYIWEFVLKRRYFLWA